MSISLKSTCINTYSVRSKQQLCKMLQQIRRIQRKIQKMILKGNDILMDRTDTSVKCLVVGDAMIGKTCLIKSLLGIPLSKHYETTVFLDYYTGYITGKNQQKTFCLFTDLSMENEISYLPIQNEQQIIIVCYSAIDRESFDNVNNFWLPLIQQVAPRNPVLLVSTQSDLRDVTNPNHVTFKEGLFTLKERNRLWLMEFSMYQNNQEFIDKILCIHHTHKRTEYSKSHIILRR